MTRAIAICFVVVQCGAALPVGAYSDKPEDVYLEGYLAFQKGEELIKNENRYDALTKLREAKDRFDYVWRTWPTWQPQMVEYRRKAVHKLVAETEVEVNRAVAEEAPGGPIGIPPPPPRPAETYTGDPMRDAAERYRALEEENRRQKQFLADKERQIEVAQREKESAVRERQRLQVQVTELEGRARMSVEASQRLAEAQAAAEAAQANERAANEKVASLEVKLQGVAEEERAKVEAELRGVAAEERAKVEAELSAAQKVAAEAQAGRGELEQKVAALGEELNIARSAAAQAQVQLEAAQEAAREMQAGVGEANAQAESYALEKEELQRRIAALEKDRARIGLLSGSGGPSDAVIEDLMGDLDRTKQELSSAKGEILELKEKLAKQQRENQILQGKNAELVAELQQSGELLKVKGEQILALRKELESVNAEIARLREENESYKIQVAEFQVELKNTAAKLSEAMRKADEIPAEVPEELTAENKLMKGHIIRMMRGQALRKQQKELMIEELTKYGNNSSKLIEMLDVFTHEAAITEDVAEMIQGQPIEDLGDGRSEAVMLRSGDPGGFPELPGYGSLGGNTGGEGHGASAVSPAVSPSQPGDLASLLRSAGEACRAGRFGESETAYQDYLRADPDNPTALANFGLVKMNLGKFREAEDVLRKALSYSPQDPFSQFVLGVNAYQEGDLTASKESLEGSLRADPNNAQAYHYLGVIAIEEGQREVAVEHFRKAVGIDPGYGTAHYNLSVLYATAPAPDLQLARSHYAIALESGAERDPAMDKLVY